MCNYVDTKQGSDLGSRIYQESQSLAVFSAQIILQIIGIRSVIA